MIRTACLCLVVSSAANAWEFTAGQPCLLTHAGPEGAVALTYDPTRPLYTITVTRETAWPEADLFTMRFDGPQARQIGTDRHRLSADGRSLTVADVGFGNVLDGLQYNTRTTAKTGGAEISFSLEGAADPVAQFRACAVPAPSS